MKPRPWSHSALECHNNCPEQYHHKYVLKDLPPEAKSAEQDWGILVHKTFEDYLNSKPSDRKLPIDLMIHKPYLDRLLEIEGILFAERKVAIGLPFGPCGYFDKNVWWRGVIDVTVIEREDARAKIADYKTGKKKDDWTQLALNAVWVFLAHPEVNLINAQFYWTKDQTVTKKVWSRAELDSLVQMFTPKLLAYVHSFKNDVWPKKLVCRRKMRSKRAFIIALRGAVGAAA